MGRIVISENISLDGVVEDPTGEEGSVRGGWFPRAGGTDREAWNQIEFEEAKSADALLLGRRSYEFFAARWPSRTGDWADRLNALPKYVVSANLENPTWNRTTVLKGDAVESVSLLRQETDGDIVVYASAELVATLIEHDLVDEYRIMVHPVVLGGGRRLFTSTGGRRTLQLIDTRQVGDGIVFSTYRPS